MIYRLTSLSMFALSTMNYEVRVSPNRPNEVRHTATGRAGWLNIVGRP